MQQQNKYIQIVNGQTSFILLLLLFINYFLFNEN